MKFTKIILTLLITTLVFNSAFSQDITADTIKANEFFEKAMVFKDSSQFDSAIVYFEKSEQIYHKAENWTGYLKSCTNQNQIYLNKWKIEDAITVQKKPVEISAENMQQKNMTLSDAYFYLGLPYAYQGKNDTAIYYWNKALEISLKIKGENHRKTATLLNAFAVVYNNTGKYEKAISYHKKIIKFREADTVYQAKSLLADSYNNIATVYFNISRYDLALDYHFKALKIRKEFFGEKSWEMAQSYGNIGVVYMKLYEYQIAKEYLNKSLIIRKEILGKNDFSLSENYNNLGVVYSKIGEFQKSLQNYTEAQRIYKKILGETSTYIGLSYNNMASLYLLQGENEKALEFYQEALELYETYHKEDQKMEIAVCYDNIGLCYFAMHKDEDAIKYYNKSLEIKKTIFSEKNISLTRTYANLANSYKNLNQIDKSLENYQKSIYSNVVDCQKITVITKLPPIESYVDYSYLLEALKYKAEIFVNQSNLDLTSFEANQIALQHFKSADTLITIARQEITLKPDKLELGKQANEIYKNAINVCINLTGFENLSGLNYNEQAFYFSERNKASVLLEALAGAEALKFAGIPDTLLQQEHNLRINIANFKNMKNNAENDSIETIWNDKLFNEKRSYDSLTLVLETDFPEYFNLKYNNSPATVPEIQEILDKKTAMLSYTLTDSAVFIFAIGKKDFITKKVDLPDSVDIAKMVFDLRFDISDLDVLQEEVEYETNYSVAEYEKLAFQFYQLLFPPEIQEFLKGGMFYDIENLIIIPDGHLATIPFETFFTEKYTAEWTDWDNKDYFRDMPFLVKKYNISYSYSATLFQNTVKKNVAKHKNPELTNLKDWIALAPVFDDSGIAGATRSTKKLQQSLGDSTLVSRGILANGEYVSPLPGTLTEVENILKLYDDKNQPASIKTHKQANEQLVASGELAEYKYIHFATHGFVNTEKPELSGIFLAQDTTQKFESYENIYGNIAQQSDGVLYQSEIYNLELNSDLVVLSACETGLGKITSGEGVIGLTRALLYAGTDNIVVSLWQVSDKSTSLLMQSFYKNILQNQKPDRSSRPVRFSKSLRKSKLEMIEKGGKYAHPYFWSPFILIGE